SLEGELFIHSSFPTTQQDAVFFGPDTYRFVYHLKQYLATEPRPFKRAAEICCGTSAAAISIAKYFPDHEEIFVADLTPKPCSIVSSTLIFRVLLQSLLYRAIYFPILKVSLT